MEMSKNHSPAGVRRIHLIAVCGTAMGALACIALLDAERLAG